MSVQYLKRDMICGSGFSGFAINEIEDMFPCIFGVKNKTLSLGNILNDDMEKIWFESSKLNYFRKMDLSQPCRRCKKKYEV